MVETTAIGYRENLAITAPGALEAQGLEVPELGPHDLLVEVQAVSVNPIDIKLRTGVPAEGFKVLGFDASGVVKRTGSAVTLFTPGDQVYYAGSLDRPGSNQQLHVVDERITGRKPASLSFADAASLPLTAITAWESLVEHLLLDANSTGSLVVVGATGGVGSIMVQLVRALFPGVTIIATASDDERAAWVKDLGAHHVVNHRQDLAGQVAAIVPEGADWLFTAYSEGQIETYAQILRPFGHIVAIDDGPRDVLPLKRKSITWHWELMFTRALYRTPDMVEQHKLLNQVADLVDRGDIRPTTTRVLSPISVETVREAHQHIEDGHVLGKIVLQGW